MSDRDRARITTEVRDQIVALMPRLRRFGLALTGSQDDGDDLVQSTVERALLRQESWQDGTRLDSWLFTIARRIWIDQMRSRKRSGVHVGTAALEYVRGEDGRAIVEARSTLERTWVAMATLPEEQREVVTLILIDGTSYKECAAILDVPIGTIMSRLSRGRAALETAVLGPPGNKGPKKPRPNEWIERQDHDN